MTELTDKEKLQQLVYGFDLDGLKIGCLLPESLRSLVLTEEFLKENTPSLEDRAATVAYTACYYSYLNTHPDGTEEDFRNRADLSEFEKVADNIQTKLKAEVTLQELVDFHNKNFNTTRVRRETQTK